VAESAIDRFIDLQETYREELEERRASVRDLLHVAVMHDAGLEAILTADRDFDLLDTKRLDPIALVRKARRNPRAI
jgi:predicted nucleic acid-binding protein